MKNISIEELVHVSGGAVKNPQCSNAIKRLMNNAANLNLLDAIMYCQNLSVADYDASFIAALR